MRFFVIALLVAFATADVSELFDNGYNYPSPSGYGLGSGSEMVGDYDGSVGGNFGPGLSGGSYGGEEGVGLGGSGGELDFDMRPSSGFQSVDSAPTVSKRFFTVTAQDNGQDDDDTDESSSNSGGHKSYDVVFANNPATGSLKSALRAVSRLAGDHQTAIYVLSQQLGVKQLGAAFRAAGIKPSKPNVHFVKYRTPEEAARAQQQIRAQYDGLGGSSEEGGHESAPVQSFGGSYGRRRYGSRGPSYGGSYGGNYGNYGHGPSGLSSHGYGHGHGPAHYGGYSSGRLSNQYLPPRY